MPEQSPMIFKGPQENSVLNNINLIMSDIQLEATKKQENMAHSHDENQ